MKFKDVEEKLNNCLNKPFNELFNEDELKDIVRNKGKSGQLLEKYCGIENGNSLVDLEDMEIKSFKRGQTIAISQISSHINEMISGVDFKDSWIYKKIKTVLFNEVDKKDPDPKNWKYLQYKIISLNENEGLFNRLEKEFYSICDQVRSSVANGGMIHTCNGDGNKGRASKAFLQIRTKDSEPYHPIKYGEQEVSLKNYAFYFKNAFTKEVILDTAI